MNTAESQLTAAENAVSRKEVDVALDLINKAEAIYKGLPYEVRYTRREFMIQLQEVRGLALYESGKYAECIPVLHEVCKAAPEQPGIFLVVGKALRKLNRPKDALEYVRYANDLVPEGLSEAKVIKNALETDVKLADQRAARLPAGSSVNSPTSAEAAALTLLDLEDFRKKYVKDHSAVQSQSKSSAKYLTAKNEGTLSNDEPSDSASADASPRRKSSGISLSSVKGLLTSLMKVLLLVFHFVWITAQQIVSSTTAANRKGEDALKPSAPAATSAKNAAATSTAGPSTDGKVVLFSQLYPIVLRPSTAARDMTIVLLALPLSVLIVKHLFGIYLSIPFAIGLVWLVHNDPALDQARVQGIPTTVITAASMALAF